jgi:hypothetical protein
MSESRFKFGQIVTYVVKKCYRMLGKDGPGNGLVFKGFAHVEHWRDGRLLSAQTCPNGVVDVGITNALDVLFDAQTQITSWYMGLIDDPATLAAGDTMASHAGWTEITTYDEATRELIAFDAAAAKSVANGTTSADFTQNATDTIHGVFITDASAKGGATGQLWATAAFASALAVTSGDVVKVTYTVTGA